MNHRQPQTLDSLTTNNNLNSGSDPGFGSVYEPVTIIDSDLDTDDVEVNIDSASSAINNEENDPGRVDFDAEYERLFSVLVDMDSDDEWFLTEWESLGNNILYDDNGTSVLPAAKLVVENFPVVEIGDGGGVGCAVCTEEIGVGDKASRLHCGHYYHGECIGPWLAIKNTCPLCRYELPTHDPEYEGKRKIRR